MAEFAEDVPTDQSLAAFPADKFKAAFLSWYVESEHHGWDGFSDREVNTFMEFMSDFGTFLETSTPEDFVGFATVGGIMIDFSTGEPKLQ